MRPSRSILDKLAAFNAPSKLTSLSFRTSRPAGATFSRGLQSPAARRRDLTSVALANRRELLRRHQNDRRRPACGDLSDSWPQNEALHFGFGRRPWRSSGSWSEHPPINFACQLHCPSRRQGRLRTVVKNGEAITPRNLQPCGHPSRNDTALTFLSLALGVLPFGSLFVFEGPSLPRKACTAADRRTPVAVPHRRTNT